MNCCERFPGRFGRLLGCATICVFTVWSQAQLASGALINLNFTGMDYSGDATSPATPDASAGIWNNVVAPTGNADDFEGASIPLALSDNSGSKALDIDYGRKLDWSDDSVQTYNESDLGPGVYDVPSLYESGIGRDGGSGRGLRFRGLEPGKYEVFLVPMYRDNLNSSDVSFVDADVQYSIGTGNDTDNVDDGNVVVDNVFASPTVNIQRDLTTWVAATDGTTPYNYISAVVTVDSSDRWVVIQVPDPSGSQVGKGERVGFSTVQIRSIVPEPASLALLLSCGCALFLRPRGVVYLSNSVGRRT